MKAEIWAEVGDAVAGGGLTPKLEAALGNILAGRSNHFPRPPPQSARRATRPRTHRRSKARRTGRRAAGYDAICYRATLMSQSRRRPQQSRRATLTGGAAHARDPLKEDPGLQLRRALVDALLKCADATSAAQFFETTGPRL